MSSTLCAGCNQPLGGALVRPNRRYHDERCCARAYRRRRRDEDSSAFGGDASPTLTPDQEAVLAQALDETRLVLLVAKAAR
jgi:hypothetical protein